MRVYLIANNKGGVGKTTIALNKAHDLVKRGKVLLIDADIDQADATFWSLGSDDFESGRVYETSFGFDVCWITTQDEIPNPDGYQYVVVDGRPSALIEAFFIREADIVLIPYDDTQRAYSQAKMFEDRVKKLNSETRIKKVANKVKKVNSDDLELPYDRAIRREKWNKGSSLYQKGIEDI